MSGISILYFAELSLLSRTDGKFIVVQLKNEVGKKKIIVRGGAIQVCHEDHFLKVKEEAIQKELFADCLGGGKYKVDESKKTVYVWGQSGIFGQEPDREQTFQIFEKGFPGYQVPRLNILEIFNLGLEQ